MNSFKVMNVLTVEKIVSAVNLVQINVHSAALTQFYKMGCAFVKIVSLWTHNKTYALPAATLVILVKVLQLAQHAQMGLKMETQFASNVVWGKK